LKGCFFGFDKNWRMVNYIVSDGSYV